MGLLAALIAPYISDLTLINGGLIDTMDEITTSNWQLGTWVTELSLKFQGQAADALQMAFDEYDALALRYTTPMNDAVTAAQTCIATLQNQTDEAEASMSDPYTILPQAMAGVTLNDIATHGGGGPSGNAFNAATTLYNNYIDQLRTSPDRPSPGLPGSGLDPSSTGVTPYTFSGNVPDVLQAWGDGVQRAIATFDTTLGTLRPPAQIPVPTDDPFTAFAHVPPITSDSIDVVASAELTFLLDQNQQNLAYFIFSHYNDRGGKFPFGITKIGSNTILVTIAGLEPGQWFQANNLMGAADTGLLEKYGSKYTQEIYAAIQGYIDAGIKSGQLQVGTRVILAGHSLGGMAAQLIAQQNQEQGGNFTVSNVITFGSPPMYDPTLYPNVAFTRFRDLSDPVPHLSTYNLLRDPNANNVLHNNYINPNADIPVYSETLVPDIGVVTKVLPGMWKSTDPYKGGTETFTGPFAPEAALFNGAHLEYPDSAWLGDQSTTPLFHVDHYSPTLSYTDPANIFGF